MAVGLRVGTIKSQATLAQIQNRSIFEAVEIP